MLLIIQRVRNGEEGGDGSWQASFHRVHKTPFFLNLLVVSYLLSWIVPSKDTTLLFIYFLAFRLMGSLAHTSINGPHLALLNDLTSDPDTRFQINILRSISTGLGSFFAIVITALVTGMIQSDRIAFPIVAICYCSILTIAVCNCVYQTAPYSISITKDQTPRLSVFSR